VLILCAECFLVPVYGGSSTADREVWCYCMESRWDRCFLDFAVFFAFAFFDLDLGMIGASEPVNKTLLAFLCVNRR